MRSERSSSNRRNRGFCRSMRNELEIQGQVIKLEDFNEPGFDFEESMESESSYRSRKNKFEKSPGKKKRWVLFLVLFLILAAGFTVSWHLGFFSGLPGALFSSGEQTVTVRLPEALLANSNIKEAMVSAAGEEGRDEAVQDENGTMAYALSVEARDSLLGTAMSSLEEKIADLKDERQHPYLADISYDSAYSDFHLIVDREQVQYEQALVTVSELYMLAAFYQQIRSGADPAREVLITVEDAGSGSVLEQLVYPNDLARMAEVLVSAGAPAKLPATPQAGDQVIVTTGPDNLNLRNGPEITYLIIDILGSGTLLEVIGTEGLWLNVITSDGREGWVHGSFVEIYSEDDEESN
jgi:hypothetical protein